MELIITEKASVARTIASVLNVTERADGYLRGRDTLISWCIGHLVELALPEAYDPKYVRWRYKDLPILPAQWQYNVSEATKKQFGILKSLMNDERVTGIICATDAGREGELIFRLVYEKAGCQKPVRRLWISSMEESAIRDGLRSMKSMSDYDNLYRAALCRSQADWLIGMNATRLYSLLYGPTLHVGRVMTPTLAMLSAREAAISDFKPESFYTVKLDTGRGVVAQSERYADLNDARRLADSCNHNPAVVTRVEHKQRSENAPALYDLTALQRDANKLFGYTAQQTMEYAQGLYEKKMLTYPRSDSRHLTHDMEPSLRELAARVCGALPFADSLEPTVHPEQVIDDSKVTDHHALIPTVTMPGQTSAIDALTTGERDLLHLVCTRMLCALDDPFLYDETILHIECAGHNFTLKGRKVLQMGWKRIWYAFRGSLGGRLADEGASSEPSIPEEMTEGFEFPFPQAAVAEGKTTPPGHHTEASILHAMETAGAKDMPEDAERRGIGTPATRAAILEKLVSAGFVERKKSKKTVQLMPTQAAVSLITVLPEQLQSPLLTAEWEYKLKEIERGELAPEAFLDGISDMLKELVSTYEVVEGAQVLFPSERESIGRCPRCGGDVTERKQGFFCENPQCRFALWKDSKFFSAKKKQLTKAVAAELLGKGKVPLKGCYSEKTGKTYDTVVVLEDDGQRINFRLEFDHQKGGRR